jgi:hypothetical protein
MATLKSGRRVSTKRQARRALANAVTRAAGRQDSDDQVTTLLAGIATATHWLDGTHEKLAGTAGSSSEPHGPRPSSSLRTTIQQIETHAVGLLRGVVEKPKAIDSGYRALMVQDIRQAYELGSQDAALQLAEAYQRFLDTDDPDVLRDVLIALLPPAARPDLS